MIVIILENVKFRWIENDFDKGDYCFGDIILEGISHFYRSKKEGYLIIQKYQGIDVEIEFELAEFRKILRDAGYNIIPRLNLAKQLRQN